MGAWKQLKLLIWKDFLVRRRNPGVIGLTVGWAIAVFMVLYIVRESINPEYIPTCQYKARALPSAGLFPFLQSFVCNVDNKCENISEYEEIPQYKNAKLTNLLHKLQDAFSDEEVLSIFKNLPNMLALVKSVGEGVDTVNLEGLFGRGVPVFQIVKNPPEMKRLMRKSSPDLDESILDDIFNASFKFGPIFQSIGSTNLSVEICNSTQLQKYLLLKNASNIEEVSRNLCNINTSMIPSLLENVLSHADFDKFLNKLQEIVDHFTTYNVFEDVGKLVDVLLNLESVNKYLPKKLKLTDWLPNIFPLMNTMNKKRVDKEFVINALDIIEPYFNETDDWHYVKEIILTNVDTLIIIQNHFVESDAVKNISMNRKNFTSFIINDFYMDASYVSHPHRGKYALEKSASVFAQYIFNQTFYILHNFNLNSYHTWTKIVNMMDLTTSLHHPYQSLPYYILLYLYNKDVASIYNVLKNRLDSEEIIYEICEKHNDTLSAVVDLGPEFVNSLLACYANITCMNIFIRSKYNASEFFCSEEKFKQISTYNYTLRNFTELCELDFDGFIIDVTNGFRLDATAEAFNETENGPNLFMQSMDTNQMDLSSAVNNTKYLVDFVNKKLKSDNPKYDWEEIFPSIANSEWKEVLDTARKNKALYLINTQLAYLRVYIENDHDRVPINGTTKLMKALLNEYRLIPNLLLKQTIENFPSVVDAILKTFTNKSQILELSRANDWEKYFCAAADKENDSAKKLGCEIISHLNIRQRLLPSSASIIKALQSFRQRIEITADDLNEFEKTAQEFFLATEEILSYKFPKYDWSKMEALQPKYWEAWFKTLDLETEINFGIRILANFVDIIDRNYVRIHKNAQAAKSATANINQYIIFVNDLIDMAISSNRIKAQDIKTYYPNTYNLSHTIVSNLRFLIKDFNDYITKDYSNVSHLKQLFNMSCAVNATIIFEEFSAETKKVITGLRDVVCNSTKYKKEWQFDYELKQNVVDYDAANDWEGTVSKFGKLVRNLRKLRDSNMDKTNIGNWTNIIQELQLSYQGFDFERLLFTIIDIELNTPSSGYKSLVVLWKSYKQCDAKNLTETCVNTRSDMAKYAAKFIANGVSEVVTRMRTYLKTINSTNGVNPLVLLGFSNHSGIHMMYSKLPDIIEVFVNSYRKPEFEQQILEKKTKSQRITCANIINSLSIPKNNSVTVQDIQFMRRYFCPSFFDWPVLNDNYFLATISKLEDMATNTPVVKFDKTYVSVLNDVLSLKDDILSIMKYGRINVTVLWNKPWLDKMRATFNQLKELEFSPNTTLTRLFKYIDEPENRKWIYPKHFLNKQYGFGDFTYVLKVMTRSLEKFSSKDWMSSDLDTREQAKMLIDLFEFYPKEVTGIFAYAYFRSEGHTVYIRDVQDLFCNDQKISDTLKALVPSWILQDEDKILVKICQLNTTDFDEDLFSDEDFSNVTNYDFPLEKVVIDFISLILNASESRTINLNAVVIKNLISKNILKNIFPTIGESRNSSIIKAEELIENNRLYHVLHTDSYITLLTTFLKMLQSGDWWNTLKTYENYPPVMLLHVIERIPFYPLHIVEGAISPNLPFRFASEILNNRRFPCYSNLDFGDFVDEDNILFIIQQACTFHRKSPAIIAKEEFLNEMNETEFYYKINETVLGEHIFLYEREFINLMNNGVKKPILPNWLNETYIVNKYKAFGNEMKQPLVLLQTVTAAMTDVIDVGALFYKNQTNCTWCSWATFLVRAANQQLVLSQQYIDLMCRMPEMSYTEVKNTFIDDFRWGRLYKKITTHFSYTIDDFNEEIHNVVDVIRSQIIKFYANKTLQALPNECFRNLTNSPAARNITTYISVASELLKLVKSTSMHYINKTSLENITKEIEADIPILIPLNSLVKDNSSLIKNLKDVGFNENQISKFFISSVNVNKFAKLKSPEELENYLSNPILYISLFTYHDDIVHSKNFTNISHILYYDIKDSDFQTKLTKWRANQIVHLDWFSKIFDGLENVLLKSGNLFDFISTIDFSAITNGTFNPSNLLQGVADLLRNNSVEKLFDSFRDLIKQLSVVIHDKEIEQDLYTFVDGVESLNIFKNLRLLTLKYNISDLTHGWDNVTTFLRKEIKLSPNVINEILNGSLDMLEIFSSQKGLNNIKNYLCNSNELQTLFYFNSDDSAETAVNVSESLCHLDRKQLQKLTVILIKNINFSNLLQKVVNSTTKNILNNANLSEEDGKNVMKSIGPGINYFPTLRNVVSNVSNDLKTLPQFDQLQSHDFTKSVIISRNMVSSATTLLCGRALVQDNGKIYRTIAEAKDFSSSNYNEMEEMSLPTQFCRNIYRNIVDMDAGKVIWSYMKPLIRGKIIFTPNTPVTRGIMEATNNTFSRIAEFQDILLKTINNVEDLDDLENIVENIQDFMSSFIVQTAVQRVMEEENIKINNSNFNISNIFDDFGGIEKLKSTLIFSNDILRCILLDRFVGVDTENDLEHEAKQLMQRNEFIAGVVFLNINQRSKRSIDVPHNITYKIRMDIDSVPTTNYLRYQFWTPGPDSDFLDDLRYFRGFVQLQDLLDNAIIKLQSNKSNIILPNWNILTQQMPYPCWTRDFFKSALSIAQGLQVCFFFGFIVLVAASVRYVVWEKESGNTMVMNVMGLKYLTHCTSWFIVSLVEMLIVILCAFIILLAGRILQSTSPTLLFVYMLDYGFSVVMFCYMVSSMFDSASVAAVGSAIFYLLSFMPYIIIISLETTLSVWLELLVNLSMSTSFCYGCLYIIRYEVQGIGLNWSNVWSTPLPGDNMNFGMTCVFLAFDGILYGVIGYLCSKSTQELKKIFHYLPKRFFPNRYQLIKEEPSYITFDNELYGTNYPGENYLNATVSSTNVVNDEPLKIGVTIKGLTKIYNTRKKTVKAIENIDITLYTGQVTTLLGHNGAGKTTLIKILTGMMKPTDGQIIINSEIMRSSNKSCKYLGVCSQTSVLIDTMSAREHLIFYAKLKTSGDFTEITSHVLNMIDSLGLGPLADEPVSHLSEGMRRRLCVAIAFIGKPKLVVLDEPSSGVDPVARRQIWDLVVRHKEGCTVLLTTHYLDEAELLSDRVVVLHKGKVLCSGSPLILKHTYGNGYKLVVTYPSLRKNYEVNETKLQSLLTTVKQWTPNASLSDVQGCTVNVTVPFMCETGTPNNYEQLALDLEENQAKLGFLSFSMNCTTLEQVFLELCANADAKDNGKPSNAFEKQIQKSHSSIFSNSVDELNNFKDDMELIKTGATLTGSTMNKFFALMKKRAVHYLLDWRIIVCALLLPTIFTAVAMGFSLIRPPNTNEPSLKLSPDLYQPHTTSFISIDTKHLDSYVNEVSQKLVTLSWRNQDLEEYAKKPRNCQCESGMQKCQVTDKVSDVMLKLSSANDTVDWLIETHNEYIQRRYGGWSLSEQPDNSSAMVIWYNNKGYHSMPAYLSTMNNAILQTVSPGSTITTYSHPLKLSVEQLSKSTIAQHIADVGIAMVLLVAFSLVPASGSIYLVQERINEEKRLQFLCGVSPTLYWIVAFIWDMIVLIGALLLAIVVFNIFGLPVYVARDNMAAVSLLILLYGWACIPFIHLTQRFFNEASMANMILFCCCAFIGITELTCLLLMDILGTTKFVEDFRYILHKIYLIFPQFVLGDGLVEISKNNIQSDILKRFHMDTYISPLSWDLMGLHYLCLVIVGILLFLINLAIENQWFKKTKQTAVNYPSDTCCLETVKLCKEYNTVSGKIAAVDNLTLKVPFGQCVGLIGVNGAGKSTTFKMMTTEIPPTRGKIFLLGRDLDSKPLCTGEMGYCPQCDALDPKLTVLQTMKFYLTLRGVSNQYEISRRLMSKFELISYANRRNENLSGGNKRKLCTALSILGKTSLVLMDEPTSGMDPYSRNLVGLTIQQITRQNRSVILTSHSVEDCENLCSQVIVMINGKMICQGSPQDLKERFGSGYIISVRLAKPTDQNALLELIQSHFPGAELMSRQYCSSQFTVPTDHILVSQMFNTMSKISESVSVEDYNLVQCSLDQVFINLANKSNDLETQNQKSSFPDMYTMTVL